MTLSGVFLSFCTIEDKARVAAAWCAFFLSLGFVICPSGNVPPTDTLELWGWMGPWGSGAQPLLLRGSEAALPHLGHELAGHQTVQLECRSPTCGLGPCCCPVRHLRPFFCVGDCLIWRSSKIPWLGSWIQVTIGTICTYLTSLLDISIKHTHVKHFENKTWCTWNIWLLRNTRFNA